MEPTMSAAFLWEIKQRPIVVMLNTVNETLAVLAKKKRTFNGKYIFLYLYNPLHPKYAKKSTTTEAIADVAT